MANVVYLLVQWLFTVFATRMINVEAAGMLSFAVSLTNILYTIENYGMRPYQVSDSRGEFSARQYINLRYLTTAIGIALCMIFLAITGFSAEKTFIVFLFFLYRSWEAVSDVYYGELQKTEHLHCAAYSMLIKSALSLALFAVLTYITRGLIIPLVAINIVAILMVVIDRTLFIKKNKVVRIEGEATSVRGPLKIGFFMMLAMLFPILVTSLPRMSLDSYYGEKLLGYFGNVAMPTTLIVAIVPNLLTPIMSLYGRWINDKEYGKFRKMYVLTLIGSAAISIVFLLGFLLLGEWFMSLVYGDDIIEYLHYMYPLIFTTMLYAVTMCNSNALIAQRNNTYAWISSALSCVISIVCCFTLVKGYAIEGLIATLAISYGTQILIQLIGIISKFISYKKQTN